MNNRTVVFVGKGLVLLSMVALAACAPRPHDPEAVSAREEQTPIPPAAPIAEAARPAVPAVPAAKPILPALTLNQYHQAFAQHLLRENDGRTFDGAPPNPLYALVVLQVELDRDGKVARVTTLRVPSHAQELLKVARESIARGAPYPKPILTVALGRPTIALTETWLFNRDGRFQLRSAALPQQELAD